MVIQLFITSRLLSRFGIIVAILILPTLATRQFLDTILPVQNIPMEICITFCTIILVYVPLFYLFALTKEERIKYKEYTLAVIKK